MIADGYDNKQNSSSISQKEQGMRGRGFLTLCAYKKIQTLMFMCFRMQRVLNPELYLDFQ